MARSIAKTPRLTREDAVALNSPLSNPFYRALDKPKPKNKPALPKSWLVSKAQKQMIDDIDNERIIPLMYTDYADLVLDFRCMMTHDKINRSILLAIWRKGLIRYNYITFRFELSKLGLKFMKLNNEKKTPGIINVKPDSVKPYKSKASLRHEKYLKKNKA